MYCDEETQMIVDRIGHDAFVKWKDSQSGIIFTATQFDMVNALLNCNGVLAVGGGITLEDFLYSVPYTYMKTPDNINMKTYLNSGWSPECFSCWDGVFIDISFKAKRVDNEYCFVFNFIVPYCTECYECEGCDRASYYDSYSQKTQAS